MEWIPINKEWPDKGELPPIHVDVLISYRDDVYMASLRIDSWFIEGLGICEIDDVDAWMPKPKPYSK